MNSLVRVRAEAEMAATARDIATTDAAFALNDQVWAGLTTAGNHIVLADRWTQIAAADRQAAAQPPRMGIAAQYLRGSLGDPAAAQAALEERAAQSAQIAANHQAAAEQLIDAAQKMINDGGTALAMAPAAAPEEASPAAEPEAAPPPPPSSGSRNRAPAPSTK